MITSIEKVEVTELSRIRRLTYDNVKAEPKESGVYLLFTLIDGKEPYGYRDRDYCKIGRAVTVKLNKRLKENIDDHGKPGHRCGTIEGHFYQILVCENETEAARLERLFHLWHLQYRKRKPREGSWKPIEPEGVPLAHTEPDSFYVEPL